MHFLRMLCLGFLLSLGFGYTDASYTAQASIRNTGKKAAKVANKPLLSIHQKRIVQALASYQKSGWKGMRQTLTGFPELVLTKVKKAQWKSRITLFLAKQLSLPASKLRLKLLGGGRSGAPVYLVRFAQKGWVFKIFRSLHEGVLEAYYLQKISSKSIPNLKAVKALALWRVRIRNRTTSGFLMSLAKGRSVRSWLKRAPTTQPASQPSQNKPPSALTLALQKVARGMADFHKAFRTGKSVTAKALQGDCHYIQSKLKSRLYGKLNPKQTQILREVLGKKICPSFVRLSLPATLVHGDANIGNFMVAAHSPLVTIIDVTSMRWSFDKKGQPNRSAVADVGRFVASFSYSSRLSQQRTTKLVELFLNTYCRRLGISRRLVDKARTLYQVEFLFAVIRFARNPSGIQRALKELEKLLGVGLLTSK